MSSGSVGSNKSLNGNNIGEFDSIDLTQWTGALTIEGASGTAGQVLKKNATTNKIEWGADTPGSLSASSPIVLTGTTLSLGTNFGSQAITTTGTITANSVVSGGVVVCKGATNPLTLSSGNMVLNYNTGDFQLDGSNKLELKDTFVKTASNPLSVSTGNVILNYDTDDFQLQYPTNKLELKSNTISSIALGGNLANLTNGTNITTLSYNGASAKSINLNSALTGMVSITVDSYGGFSIKHGSTTSFSIGASGEISMFGLPTSDYGLSTGRIYNSYGTLKIK